VQTLFAALKRRSSTIAGDWPICDRAVLRAASKILQVIPHHRLEVGVDDYRRGALVLAKLRENLVRDGERNAERLESFRNR
jgi:hypothetical protein